MSLQSILEEEQQALLAELSHAGTPDRAAGAAGKVLDRVLFRYNESCGSERCRRTAAELMGVLKLALPLMDTNGEARVWESSQKTDGKAGPSGILSGPGLLLLFLGLILGGVSLFLTARGEDGSFRFAGGLVSLGLLIGGIVLAAAAGWIAAGHGGKKQKSGNRSTYTEVRIDGEKVCRRLKAAAVFMDQVLLEAEADEAKERKKLGGTNPALPGSVGRQEADGTAGQAALPGAAGEAVTEDSMELFGKLLEASCAGDGQYALDCLREVKYYLHRNGIEAEDYTEAHRDWFDTLPSDRNATFRPALTKGGKLLKKGLAGKAP